jgi:hypothetical protein
MKILFKKRKDVHGSSRGKGYRLVCCCFGRMSLITRFVSPWCCWMIAIVRSVCRCCSCSSMIICCCYLLQAHSVDFLFLSPCCIFVCAIPMWRWSCPGRSPASLLTPFCSLFHWAEPLTLLEYTLKHLIVDRNLERKKDTFYWEQCIFLTGLRPQRVLNSSKWTVHLEVLLFSSTISRMRSSNTPESRDISRYSYLRHPNGTSLHCLCDTLGHRFFSYWVRRRGRGIINVIIHLKRRVAAR